MAGHGRDFIARYKLSQEPLVVLAINWFKPVRY